MTIIVQDVFKLAMDLMDETSEDGTIDGYSEEYKKKAWSILTMLQAELLSFDVSPPVLSSNTDEFLVDDHVALTAFPYGLAAHLLMAEDQSRATFFNARYDELKKKMPATLVIDEVYGLDGGGC